MSTTSLMNLLLMGGLFHRFDCILVHVHFSMARIVEACLLIALACVLCKAQGDEDCDMYDMRAAMVSSLLSQYI